MLAGVICQLRWQEASYRVAEMKGAAEILDTQLCFARATGPQQRGAQHPWQQAATCWRRQQLAVSFDEHVGEATFGDEAGRIDKNNFVRAGGVAGHVEETAQRRLVAQSEIVTGHW